MALAGYHGTEPSEVSKSPMQKMIFWGATGQAKVLRESLTDRPLELVALFDNNRDVVSPFPGVPLYHGKAGLDDWIREEEIREPIGFLVAIGGDKGKVRLEIQEYLESLGFRALIARHRTSFIAGDAKIGYGSQILAQAVVGVETTIGSGCIINTAATVDHEGTIGSGVHICPGAHLAGCVKVENFATVGTGAVVLPRITIGEGAIVGAGAVVTKDVPPYTVVVGNPAKVLRSVNQ